MARIRSVHPSLFTDEAWVSCSPLARILLIGLWTDADDQGVFEWKPLQIKMRLLPGDAADVAELLGELQAAGLIKAFSVDGKRFGAIGEFREKQRPKSPNSVHPLPPELRIYVALPPPILEADHGEAPALPDHFGSDGEICSQMEDGGEDGEKEEDVGKDGVEGGGGVESRELTLTPLPINALKSKRLRRCPGSWHPTQDHFDIAADRRMSQADFDKQIANLRDHEFDPPRSDWDAVARKWLRDARLSSPTSRPSGTDWAREGLRG